LAVPGSGRLTPLMTEVYGSFWWLSRPGVACVVGAIALGIIAVADYLTGYEMRLALLYLLPIGLVTWSAGVAWGAAFSIAATATWGAMSYSGHVYSSDFYFVWEGVELAASFLVVVILISRLRRALAMSDERFVTVLESLDAAVYVQARAGSPVLFSNRRFREAFGSVPPPAPPPGEFFDESSGRWYLVRSREIGWLDARKVTLRVLADITELKEAAESLRRHREALESSAQLVAMGELGSALAHELNQPLAAVATYLDTGVMLLAKGDSAALGEVIERCRAQASRAGAIVHRLREFLRHRTTSPEPADLNEIVQHAVRLARSQFPAGTADIEIDLAPDLPPVVVDALLIEQVLVNLLENGAEAMQSVPASERRLAVRSAAQGSGVVVSIADAGPGIAGETAGRIFDPFFTTKKGGLGLGLGICRSIIEGHGGRLWHDQQVARGAVFAFSLPAGPR
jgi:C4-dicarboxylate-specific signal transduction histidine kinase